MDGAAELRFHVLGPLEVRDDDRVLPLGGVKQRLVLAGLLAHSNTVVSIDRLVDILWGDAPPEDAPSTLAKYVYRLRAAMGTANASILVTRPPGYVLALAAEQLDSSRFVAMVADAQRLLRSAPAEAKTVFDDALGLWRGPVWAEFADLEFLRADVTRLDGLRAMAVEGRADAMLALGRHDELIPELQALISAHPLRERPHAQLMTALYLGGRHADALAVYRDFRRHLLDEVGLEPSAELRDLEQQILQQNVRLPHKPRVHPIAPTRAPSWDWTPAEQRLIGRRTDLNWLEVLFARGLTGHHPVLGLVGGPAGIGKTTLVKAFARRTQARGATVVFTRCDNVLDIAGSLLEVLGQPAHSSDAAPLAVIDQALATMGEGPVLLVLDDLDAADPDARSVVGHLAAMRSAAPLCAIGTARNIDTGWVSATPGAVHVRVLEGLGKAEVAELLADVSDAARPPEIVDSVCTDTAGVPSLVVAIGRKLRDVDIADRVQGALARAQASRQGLTEDRDQVARGVLARQESLRLPLASADHAVTGDRHATVCPYKGLASFGVADAAYFCGRDRLVAQLVARLAVDRFVGVVGASGSGKSSLVAAGLLPALASAALPGSDQWPSVIIRPGADPIARLASAVAPLVKQPPAAVRDHLAADPAAIEDLARRVADGQPGRRLVMIVDQFEEAFTICSQEDARVRFVEALVAGVAGPDSPLVVAVAIRADYYGACAEQPDLARLLADSHVLVPAMTEGELRQTVLEPARRAGLTAEDGLADAICTDAGGEPGALPLVSTALLETWVRRSGVQLTLAGYAQAGGVRGAVARLADGVYDGLDPAGKEILRHIFLRLADPQGPTADVRRRARRDEVASTDAERQVLATLIDHRLVTATGDTVEVAHEALLREWPRLRGWLEEDRAGRRLHRQLSEAAVAWQADNRDDAGLYRGVRLQAARDWAASHPGDANPLETEFLTASEAAHERTLRTARHTARRMRSLAVVLAALLVVAVIAGLLLAVQRAETHKQAGLARGRALQAETSRLATLARTLPDDQRDLALLLGAQGYRLEQSDETAGGLQAAVVQTPPGLDRVIRYRSPAYGPALDRDGQLLAVAGQDGAVTIFEIATGRLLHNLKWPRPREFAAFSGDSHLVAVGGYDGQVAIWDLTTGRLSGRPLAVGGSRSWGIFDPTDATRMYAVTDTGELTTWDRHDPEHPRQVRDRLYFSTSDSDPPFVVISRDGRLIAAANGGSLAKYPVDVWNARSGEHLHTFDGQLGAFAANGVTLLVGDAYGITLYNALTGVREARVPISGGTGPLSVLSADGRHVAVTGEGQDAVTVYDVGSTEPARAALSLHDNGATPLGFLPDGRLVTSGNTSAGVWSIDRTLPPVSVALPAPSGGNPSMSTFLVSPDEIITSGVHGELLRHDPATGRTLGPLLTGAIESPLVGSPDGRLLAAASARTEKLAIWDRGNGQQLAQFPDVPASASIAWSPAGDLLATALGPSTELWDVSNPRHPKLAATVPNAHGSARPDYLLFSPDGRLLVTAAAEDKHLTAIDVATHHVKWSIIIPDLAVRQVALSPDGKAIAVSSGDTTKGQVTLYDAHTGKQGRSLSTRSYGGVAYLHDGKWLVVTGGATKPDAQLYNSATLQPIGVPFPTQRTLFLSQQTTGEVFGDPIAVSNTGTMFSEAEFNSPLLWDADPAHWLAIACRIASRNLTKAEWHEYLPSRPYESTCPQWPSGQ